REPVLHAVHAVERRSPHAIARRRNRCAEPRKLNRLHSLSRSGANSRRLVDRRAWADRAQEITMAKPVIWTVDDDPDVLRAVERDLRRHYGDRYRVISADSGSSALESTKQLKLRNESVALFLVDQRMPRMSGVEFLEKAIELYPEAKRALL